MGASTSAEQVPAEEREAESLAGSTGALPILKQAFSLLSDPQSNSIPLHSLQRCFGLVIENPPSKSADILQKFHGLSTCVGTSIADLYFLVDKGGISRIEFLRGYVKCCGRMSASKSLHKLFKVFSLASQKASFPIKLEFLSDDDDGKMTGFLLPAELLMLLWMCFVMNEQTFNGKGDNSLPDLNHLVLSAVLSCAESGTEFDPWEYDILSMDVQLPVAKVCMWALKTVPSLPECFTQFVHSKIQKSITSEIKKEVLCSSTGDLSEAVDFRTNLLTRGRAWAISLTMRSSLREEVLKVCFASSCDESDNELLYRSSFHGRGLNRFWSNIDGYNGPLLILVAASLEDVHDDSKNARRWIIGALTDQALENKDNFYGNSGSLYAISPIFNVFPSAGKEKNFVYSHLHPTGRVYDPRPKPVGVSFGGSIGNERVFIDEDFAKVTFRHHAVDKTYQHGSLFPNQGFLPIEALILEVEVWGLGGRSAKRTQASYRRREELFTEQRRKVDLKTFASWEDSPEKMMMDMMSNPNAVRREDR